MSIQAVLVEGGALLLLVSTIALVRKRLLSIRYGLGWMTVSLAGLLGAPFLALLSGEARSLGFTPTGFSLGIFIIFLGLLCLQLSISLSGLHHAIQDLAEHSALLEERVHHLERTHSTETDNQASRIPFEEPA
jgi:Na+/melibiose symporter-like transporter